MPKLSMPALALVLVATLFAAGPAKAYDEDTHFYGTYAMARHAGIKHEVALKIALSAQWMDESFISDPTSMIFLPVSGIKKRRLLHFPSSRVNGTGSSGAQRQIFGMQDLGEFSNTIMQKMAKWAGYDGKLDDINFFTETQEDHPFASQMLMEGIREGNLMKAATGLHTMEDSFAHAGTPAEQGHALFWHWPDRPYASVDKYQRMVHSVMGAMVALRTMLPEEARDCSLKTAGSVPNCQADSEALASSYIPLVLPVYSHDMMRDPEYVKVALDEFYQRAAKMSYTKMSLADFHARVAKIEITDGKTDAYTAIQELLIQIFQETNASNPAVMDFGKVLEDMGRIQSASATEVQKYVDNYGRDGVKNMRDEALNTFTHVMATELLAWHVPANLTDSHRMELEDDQDQVRSAEMEIRVRHMQEFIRKNFNQDIIFVNNNTSDDIGFYKELHNDPSAQPNFSAKPGFVAKPGAVYATFSAREKNAFDYMIMSYLFPEMSRDQMNTIVETAAAIKKMMIERSDYFAERKKIDDNESLNWIMKKWNLLKLDHEFKRYKDVTLNLPKGFEIVLTKLQPLAKPYVHDLVTTHMTPSQDNFVYRREAAFQKFISDNKLQPFLGEKDVWKSNDLLRAPPANTSPVSAFFGNLF
jgi:hypothetical protein